MRRKLSSISLLGLAALSLIVAGCTGGTGTPNPDMPVDSSMPAPEPGRGTSSASGGTGGTGEPVYVNSIDLLTLESFPVQVNAVIRGSLPDPCVEIVQIKQRREGNSFTLTFITRRTGGLCPEVLQPFEEAVALDVYGLPAGTYTVLAGEVSSTFDLTIDNILADTTELPRQGQGGMITGHATVTGVEVVETQSYPPAVQINIRGYLPDPCTQISGISEQWEGNTIYLLVETSRPSDVMCAQVIVEFEQSYMLRNIPGRGTYTLVVNDVATQFTIR